MRECALEGVTGLQCSENLVPLWEDALIARLLGLRALVLSSCALTTLSPGELRCLSFSCSELIPVHPDIDQLKQRVDSVPILKVLIVFSAAHTDGRANLKF